MLRRLASLLNTISSWPLTSLIESSSLREYHLLTQRLIREYSACLDLDQSVLSTVSMDWPTGQCLSITTVALSALRNSVLSIAQDGWRLELNAAQSVHRSRYNHSHRPHLAMLKTQSYHLHQCQVLDWCSNSWLWKGLTMLVNTLNSKRNVVILNSRHNSTTRVLHASFSGNMQSNIILNHDCAWKSYRGMKCDLNGFQSITQIGEHVCVVVIVKKPLPKRIWRLHLNSNVSGPSLSSTVWTAS